METILEFPSEYTDKLSPVITGCEESRLLGDTRCTRKGSGLEELNSDSPAPTGLTRIMRQDSSALVSEFCRMTTWSTRTCRSRWIKAPCALTIRVCLCPVIKFMSGPGARTAIGLPKQTTLARAAIFP